MKPSEIVPYYPTQKLAKRSPDPALLVLAEQCLELSPKQGDRQAAYLAGLVKAGDYQALDELKSELVAIHAEVRQLRQDTRSGFEQVASAMQVLDGRSEDRYRRLEQESDRRYRQTSTQLERIERQTQRDPMTAVAMIVAAGWVCIFALATFNYVANMQWGGSEDVQQGY